MKGIVFDIRRFCVHDGPGIRTTVFLKGCPLRCSWCHNPESQLSGIEHVVKEFAFEGGKICREENLGRIMTTEEVIGEICKDMVFYNQSAGGVTFSGGEPLSQPDFLLSLLTISKEKGLHTAVDTCGYAKREHFEKIMTFTDLFLYDLKHAEASIHENFTGVSNLLILKNLRFIALSGKKINIRIPVIPGFNDSLDVMKQIADLICNMTECITGVNLLPYHAMAESKYSRLNKVFVKFGEEEPDQNNLSGFKEIFEKQGFTTKIGG